MAGAGRLRARRLDQTLETWSRESDWRLMLPLALARASVWLSRRLLAGLMLAGHAVSCFMLRQMEFDADSYEVKVAGADAFGRTSARMRELAVAARIEYEHLAHAPDARRLPADLPFLFAERSRQLPDDLRTALQEQSGARTRIFDTHPADADRIAAARTLGGAGVLVGGDEPAAALFRGVEALSAAATRHHYEHVFGLDLDGVSMASSDDALRAAGEQERLDAAANAFFKGRVSLWRPLVIPCAPCDEIEAAAAGDLAARLQEARAAMEDPGAARPEAYREFEHYALRREAAHCAEHLFLEGMRTVDADQFSLAEPTLACAESTQQWALQQQDVLRPALDAFDTLAAQRIASGVRLQARLDPSRDARPMARAVSRVAGVVPLAWEARRSLMAVSVLDSATPALGSSPHLRARIASLTGQYDRHCADIRAVLRDHLEEAAAVEPTPWRRLAESELPPNELLAGVLHLYWTLLLRVVAVAAGAEHAVRDGAAAT